MQPLTSDSPAACILDRLLVAGEPDRWRMLLYSNSEVVGCVAENDGMGKRYSLPVMWELSLRQVEVP